MASSGKLVLITGASGYLGANCVKKALEAGFRVRGTVRSLSDPKKIAPLKALSSTAENNLELVEADLMKADGWAKAVSGVDFVMHTASPFVLGTPKHEDELIKPAVEGTLNVLRAVAAADSVSKVVLTSSVVAIASGHPSRASPPLTEADWTLLDGPGVTAYDKSKTLAEKAAWDFVKAHPKIKLTVINPSFILGPLVHDTRGASSDLIIRMMKGEMPAIPQIQTATVDVRDVAEAHVRALTNEASDGLRIILSSRTTWMKNIAGILAAEFKEQGYKVPSWVAPTFVLKLASVFDGEVRGLLPKLGHEFDFETSRMSNVLGISNPIPLEQTLSEMGHSLVERGFVPKLPGYRAQ